MTSKILRPLAIIASGLLLVIAVTGTAFASSGHHHKVKFDCRSANFNGTCASQSITGCQRGVHCMIPLLSQMVQQQQLQIQLQQDNAIQAQTRLNTMTLQLQNMTGELQIIALANTVSINGTLVN
ncbi:MAG: hypothetical protein M3044_06620 [Thermoproteota archaeon]|nr:hypothetical protein [Thermoproteota archaeon]